MTHFVMADNAGIYESPLVKTATLSRMFMEIWSIEDNEPFFVSDRNGDPVVVSYEEIEEDVWAWEAYWNEGS